MKLLAYFVSYELYFAGAFNGGGNTIISLKEEIKTLADVRKLEEQISIQTAERTKEERQHIVVMSFIRMPDEDKENPTDTPKASHLKRVQ